MNTKNVICATLLASGLFTGALIAADQVFMKNGDEMEGTVTEDNGNTVVLTTLSGTSRSFRKTDVDTIIYGKKAAPAPTPAPIQVEPAPAAPVATSAQPATPAQPAPATAMGTLPAQPAAPPNIPPVQPAQPALGVGVTKTGEAQQPVAADANPNPAAPAGDSKKPEDEEKAWKAWTPPPDLASFPDHAKRMEKEKEARFMAALPQLGTRDNPSVVDSAKTEILGMGKAVLPYVVAGLQHANVETRTQCMKMLGQIEGNKNATKQAIEVFYAAMPTDGKAAWYQVPFIDAIKETLPIVTGQSFITVQGRDALVQEGLKQYIDWYNANFMQLPPQLGEKKIDKTDPDYVKKITEARKLKLDKREWPAPPAPSDLQTTDNKDNDRPPLNESTTQREADKAYAKEFNRIGRDDALKRPQDKDNSGE